VVDALAQRGRRALVAHPERHLAVDLADRLAALAARGALVQVTADTVVDRDAGPAMVELARRGVVHVVGSDSHSSRAGRPVAVSAAIERLGTVPPIAEHRDWFVRAPEAILAGEPVAAPWPAA
jgi:tyrosine-protein phosphatase YwqE